MFSYYVSVYGILLHKDTITFVTDVTRAQAFRYYVSVHGILLHKDTNIFVTDVTRAQVLSYYSPLCSQALCEGLQFVSNSTIRKRSTHVNTSADFHIIMSNSSIFFSK